jgi:hypothetical protein
MEWVNITDIEKVPTGKDLMFLTKEGQWFEGRMRNDYDFGWCVSTYESYVAASDLTHYLEIKLPN